eukprot:SAG11_NODE_1081_length_5956_cov_14.482506_9_plen_176_part_00
MGEGGFGGRWLCLSAALLATFAGTGVGYAWGVFSPMLKSSLHLSQSQLMFIALMPSYACCLPPMAFFPGWVYDLGGNRYGACVSMLLAAIGLGGGFLLMWATAERLLPFPHTPGWSVALLGTGNVLAGFGSSFSTVAVVSAKLPACCFQAFLCCSVLHCDQAPSILCNVADVRHR